MSDTAYFQVAPRLAILLGETYRSSEQAVKELVDNAWDADAEEVWIELPSLDAHLHRYSNPAHVRIQGRVTPSGLLSDVTADWGAVIENSKGYVELEEFVRLMCSPEID